MFRAKIIPKSQRAKNRVREHGEVMQVLREGNPQCFNGQKAFFVESEDSNRWQGWFKEDEVELEKVPYRPRSKEDQALVDNWKKQMQANEVARKLAHQKAMALHKKKKKKKRK